MYLFIYLFILKPNIGYNVNGDIILIYDLSRVMFKRVDHKQYQIHFSLQQLWPPCLDKINKINK